MTNSYSTLSLSRLGLVALLAVGSLSAATAQTLNYTAVKTTNTAGTYTDLGTTGTAITTANTDDANSTAQSIGFTFNYNGTAFTQFVLNTNGLVRLGSTAPSVAALYYDNNTSTTATDPLQSTSTADVNLLMPFNFDLVGGTGTPEYRVATTGTAGSRVCTIQWKNVADKAGAGSDAASGQQYANFSFQLKLHETTGVIDFVYGPATASSAAAAVRYPNVGLKGSGLDLSQVILGLKFSTDPWSDATFANYNYSTSSHNISNASLPDAGRTYQFTPTVACATTPVAIATFPYIENFDGIDVGTQPCNTQILDANNDTYSWYVSNENANSAPNALTYYYNDSNTSIGGNDWFFTPGLSLRAGYAYHLQFKYAAALSDYPEGLEVKYGTAATPAGQTNLLFSNNNIDNETFATTTQLPTITPTANGIYYIGFHVNSAPDQYELYVDDIQVTETAVLAVRNANNSVFTAQAAPVPFGQTLSIALNTLKPGPLQLTLRDALGRTVRQTTTATLPIGSSTVAMPEVGSLPAGVYFLNIEQGGATQVIRVAHE